jgi:hypothetical protein
MSELPLVNLSRAAQISKARAKKAFIFYLCGKEHDIYVIEDRDQ